MPLGQQKIVLMDRPWSKGATKMSSGQRQELSEVAMQVVADIVEQAAYEVYWQKIRERRHRKVRRVELMSPLFPAYLFTRIEQWRPLL